MGGQLVEVDRFLDQPFGVRAVHPGQQQKLVEQVTEAAASIVDIFDRTLCFGAARFRTHEHRDMRAEDRQWRTHLMRRIGGESANTGKAVVEPGEHGVERADQIAEFARHTRRRKRGQILCAAPVHLSLQPLQRREAAAHGDRHQHGGRDDQRQFQHG